MSAIFTDIDVPFALAVEYVAQADFDALMMEPADWLGEGELARYRELQINAVDKRRRQWLLGRYAAKVACRRWMIGQGMLIADWHEIEISNTQTGMPRLVIHGVTDSPSVSIAHSGDEALAAVVTSGMPIGVDMETRAIYTNLHALAKRICNDAEYQKWIAAVAEEELAERFRHLWLAKEAVAKCSGKGLQWQPGSFEVLELKIKGAEVRHGDNRYFVRFAKSADGTAALAWLS